MKTLRIKLMLTLLMLIGITGVAQADGVWLKIGDYSFVATLEDNATATAFKALCPATWTMTELNGNEKYKYLDTTLPTDASCPGTIQAGDIMLYSNNCIVVFYETFNTTYNYTKIGHIDDVTNLATALGAGNPSVTFKTEAKVVVLSDIHVMADELLQADGEAWQSFLSSDRKLVDYSKRLFDHMVAKIKDEIQPDLVFITGDLTKDGEQLSHEYVKSQLDVLKAAGIPTLIVTGNHDWGTSNAKFYNGASTTAATTLSMSELTTLYADYGFGSSEREATTLTYACEPLSDLVVIGIDSGSDGCLSSTTLNWVCDKAKAAYNSGKQVIALMHHPLIPHFMGADTFAETVSVADYANVRNAFADAGIRVIFTGHFHTSDIAKDYNGDLSRETYDVNTGSLISYPCDYRTVTLPADLSSVNITTSSVTELTSGDGFANTAKTRLTASARQIVINKGVTDPMATAFAGAFIYHAEGDEADNADAQTFLTTYGTSLSAPQKALAYSMLQDKSNYGVAGRENTTVDRTLAVTMPTLTESVTLASDGWSTYCSNYAIDLSKTTGVSGYIVSTVSAETATLQEVVTIPAETGFILHGTGSEKYTLHATLNDADDVTGNQLLGTLATTSAPANSYALSTKSGVTGFYPIQSGLNIPAHKAYLVSGAGTRMLLLSGFDDATGIAQPSGLLIPTSSFYTLQGVKVSHPTKGLYICNGKVVIIR